MRLLEHLLAPLEQGVRLAGWSIGCLRHGLPLGQAVVAKVNFR